MLGLLLLSAITIFHPAQPTVGDPITIEFGVPTVLDPSPDYEVISRSGNRAVIRTFVPHTIEVKGRAAGSPVSVMIPIHSVLKPDDKLEPAPLKPPQNDPWPRLPFLAIGVAAFAATAAWAAVIVLARRRQSKPMVVIVPAEEFRARLQALRRPSPMRWARLADAVRAYRSSIRAGLGAELTTAELLARVEDEGRSRFSSSEVAGEPPAGRRRYDGRYDERYDLAGVVGQILRQGDLEKFSPWGAAPADFDDALNRALEIPGWLEPEPVPVDQEKAA